MIIVLPLPIRSHNFFFFIYNAGGQNSSDYVIIKSCYNLFLPRQEGANFPISENDEKKEKGIENDHANISNCESDGIRILR